LSAALIDLLDEKEQLEIVKKLNQLGLHDIVVSCAKGRRSRAWKGNDRDSFS